jgi:hypothetical protein
MLTQNATINDRSTRQYGEKGKAGWVHRNQNNAFEWSEMPTRGLLFQCPSTIKAC